MPESVTDSRKDGLTVEHALRVMQLLPPRLDFVLETPCATLSDSISFCKRQKTLLLLDELVQGDHDVVEAIKQDACDGVELKVSKQGGVTALDIPGLGVSPNLSVLGHPVANYGI